MTRFLVLGGAHLDRRATLATETNLGASNPGSWQEEPGGAGFNAAQSLARLGNTVRMVSPRGGDEAGETVARAAAAAGIIDMAQVFRQSRTKMPRQLNHCQLQFGTLSRQIMVILQSHPIVMRYINTVSRISNLRISENLLHTLRVNRTCKPAPVNFSDQMGDLRRHIPAQRYPRGRRRYRLQNSPNKRNNSG